MKRKKEISSTTGAWNMWCPAPKPKVIRRPIADYTHQRPKLKKRNPLEFKPENHRGNVYFGIRHTDITDYLEKLVPSHAFSPSNTNAGPPANHGRCKKGEQARPYTAPAAMPWFGRTSSDISDWLRQLPPAHLGSDADNKPLPHFPAKSSIVTDNRWQKVDFPPVPNVLYHYWAERPGSVQLPTAPHQVQFQTILDAIAMNKSRPRHTPYTPDEGPAAVNGIHTPRSNGNSTPRSGRSTPRSQAETPRDPVTACGSRPGTPLSPGTSRPPSAAGSVREKCPETRSRPSSAAGRKRLGTPEAQCLCKCGPSDRPRSANGKSSSKALDTVESAPTRPCICGKAPETPRSTTGKAARECAQFPTGAPTPPTSAKRPETRGAEVSAQKSNIEATNGSNIPRTADPGTPQPGTPTTTERRSNTAFKRPPPFPTTPRQRTAPAICQKHPAIPFNEVIRNSRKPPEFPEQPKTRSGKENGFLEVTAEDMRLLSPDSYATKTVWHDNLRKHNKGLPWAGAIKAY